MTPYRLLLDRAQQEPERVAVVHLHGNGRCQQTTQGALRHIARRVAAACTTYHKEILPLCLGRSATALGVLLGAMGAGQAFTCLNLKLKAPQFQHIFPQLGESTVVVDGPGLMALRTCLEQPQYLAPLRWWVVDGESLTSSQQQVYSALSDIAQVSPLPDLPDHLADTTPANNPVGCALFTSGTTGRPKGILVGRQDLLQRARTESMCFHLSPEDTLLNLLPWSFDVGLNQVLAAMTAGCRLVLLDSWLPMDILRAVARCQVTGISAVPMIWRNFLSSHAQFQPHGEHASLRYITLSGGDLAENHREQLVNRIGKAGIFKTYGQTETFRTTLLPPEEFAQHPASVGRVFPGAQCWIVDQQGNLLPPHTTGEVVHGGLGTLLGHLDNNHCKEILRPNPFRNGPIDPNQVVFTGDNGYLDAQGYLYLAGRRDEMLKVAGNRLYPGEIIRYLLEWPGITDAEVVGVPNQQGETHLVAFLVTTHTGASLAELRRHLGKRLPSYMVPDQLLPRSTIPLTPNGKPDRLALQAEAVMLINQGKKAGP